MLGSMAIQLLNADCMEFMATQADNAFDLAIVDPPYGIDDKLNRSSYGKLSGGALAMYAKNRWDVLPTQKYFDELNRVSKNIIVWGGNYFTEFLPANRCWICWHKDNPAPNFSSIELAYSSFDKLPEYFYYAWGGLSDGVLGRNKKEKSIHPTQKPVKLYEWLLSNYAKEGDKILDTHLGSGSSAIAAHYGGFEFVGCELDKDYFNAAKARFNNETKQIKLF